MYLAWLSPEHACIPSLSTIVAAAHAGKGELAGGVDGDVVRFVDGNVAGGNRSKHVEEAANRSIVVVEGGVVEPDVEESDRCDALAEVEPQLHGVVAALDQRLGEPERPQELERSRLHGKRTRLVHAVELAIDDPNRGAACMQLSGERETGRPGADDQHRGMLPSRSRSAASFGRHWLTIPALTGQPTPTGTASLAYADQPIVAVRKALGRRRIRSACRRANVKAVKTRAPVKLGLPVIQPAARAGRC
jgi:hypothetical protein